MIRPGVAFDVLSRGSFAQEETTIRKAWRFAMRWWASRY